MNQQRLMNLRRLVRFALLRYSDHEDFEDIVQEAWIEAWRQTERLEGRYADSTIARVAARGAWIDWARSRKGRRQYRPVGRHPAPEVVFLEDEPATQAVLDPARLTIQRLTTEAQAAISLAAMTPCQRRAVREIILKDQSTRAAGRVLGVDQKTAWNYAQAGLRRARAALAEVP